MFFQTLPLWGNIGLFCIAGIAVWLAGACVASYADEISDRKRIGEAIMGLIFLAGVTELPELVTTITAAIKGNAALVLNNMTGGITLQTAILAVADASAMSAALTFYPRKPIPIIEGCALILLLSVMHGIALLGERPLFLGVGVGSVLLSGFYAVTMVLLKRLSAQDAWSPISVPEERNGATEESWRANLESISSQTLTIQFVRASCVILIFGVAQGAFRRTDYRPKWPWQQLCRCDPAGCCHLFTGTEYNHHGRKTPVLHHGDLEHIRQQSYHVRSFAAGRPFLSEWSDPSRN